MGLFAKELCHGIVMSGLSTKEVAFKVGIGAPHLGAIKRGECRPPKASTVRALCRVLKLNALKMLALMHVEKRPRGLSVPLFARFLADALVAEAGRAQRAVGS